MDAADIGVFTGHSQVRFVVKTGHILRTVKGPDLETGNIRECPAV
jgi:hypothetical protein